MPRVNWTPQYDISIKNRLTGEERVFSLRRQEMAIIRRALKAYKSAPKWIAVRFED